MFEFAKAILQLLHILVELLRIVLIIYLKFKKLTSNIKEEMTNWVKINYKDDPEKFNQNMEKLENSFSKFKHSNMNLTERETLFEELVEDIIQKEIYYLQKVKNVKELFEEVEHRFVSLKLYSFK